MYQITSYSYNQAKKLNVEIYPSKHKNKKIDVYKNSKYVCSIGDDRYNDYPTYLKTIGKIEADKHRERYKKRHENDRHQIGTAGYYADKLLW